MLNIMEVIQDIIGINSFRNIVFHSYYVADCCIDTLARIVLLWAYLSCTNGQLNTS